MDSDHEELSERSAGDIAHLAAKAALSAIPIVGGPAAELFGALVTPPLEKRRQEWIEEVAAVLRQLESDKIVRLEELRQNEEFTSLLVQATVVAIRNHHAEKKQALRNCVTNAAAGVDIDADIQLSFIRFVDELSPSHVKLLTLLSDQTRISAVRSYGDLYGALVPDLPAGITEAVFKMMCMDLDSRGLIWISQDIDDFPGIYEASKMLLENTRDDLPRVLVSQVGRSFLEVIAAPATS